MLIKNTEILLINSAAKAIRNPDFSIGFKECFAPLGLYCLAEIAPERIAVVDIQFAFPAEEFFSHLEKEKIQTVVFRAGKNHDEDFLSSSIKILRTLFPAARIGISGAINKNYVGLGDFFIYGTGKKTILNALRGEKLDGFINSMEDDLELLPNVPHSQLVEGFCYDAPPEKSISKRTLEVFQPWLGLFEFSNRIESYPGLNWIAALGKWMKFSGINELHFRPSGLKPDDLHELRSVMLNLGIEFSVSFKKFAGFDLETNCAGEPLKQVWLYEPDQESSAYFLSGLKSVAKAGCCPCLVIGQEALETSQFPEMLEVSARLCLTDMESWELSKLKKVFFKFWGFRSRFFRRLFSIRTAYDLIGFMKTAAVTLEILFSSEKKRRGKK